MKKTDVILIATMVIIGLAFLLWSNQAKADTLICQTIMETPPRVLIF